MLSAIAKAKSAMKWFGHVLREKDGNILNKAPNLKKMERKEGNRRAYSKKR